MSKRQVLILIGVWIIVLPFLGFPEWLKTIFFAITGLYIAIIGYTIKLQAKISNGSEIPFVEHKNDINSNQTISSDSLQV
jgi:hypothetical protein